MTQEKKTTPKAFRTKTYYKNTNSMNINRPFEDKETYLKRLKYKFWIYFITIIFGYLFLMILIIGLILTSMPTDYSFTIKMDDNTLEAFKSINYTALNYTG